MNRKLVFVAVAVLVPLGSGAFAKPTDQMVPDPGIPDTLRVANAEAAAGQKAVIDVNFYNDEELGGLTMPLKWNSSSITLDSVSFVGSRVNYVCIKQVTIDNPNQEVNVNIVVLFESYIPTGTGRAFRLYFNIPPGILDQIVTIDSTFIDPAHLLFTLTTGFNFTPEMMKGTLTIGDSRATVIHVPADQPTIQAGINAAASGDTILVAPGTYNEQVVIQGKALLIQSLDGPALTIVDGNNMSNDSTSSTFTIVNSGTTIIRGLRITGGRGLMNAQMDSARGGGIYVAGTELLVDSCDIIGNTIEGHSKQIVGGGGIYADSTTTLTVTHSALANTIIYDGAGYGQRIAGGSILAECDNTIISSCTITGQVYAFQCAYLDGGGLCLIGNHCDITNCVIQGNSVTAGSGVYVRGVGMYLSGIGNMLINTQLHNNVCQFDANLGERMDGIGAYIAGDSATVLSSVFSNNTGLSRWAWPAILDKVYNPGNTAFEIADMTGGGLWVNGDHFVIDSNTITTNVLRIYTIAIGDAYSTCTGGGIWANGSGKIAQNIIMGNSCVAYADGGRSSDAYASGGGCCINGEIALISNSIIGNKCDAGVDHAGDWGAAITSIGGGIQASGVCTVSECIIVACSTVAQIYNGAGVDSTIDGGGIITQDPNAISCSVFWENMVNNVNGGWIPDDNDNLIADPMFCAEDEHYGVYDISPCAPGNNECGILVGAGKINCIDSIPEITSPDSISVYEDSILAYRVTFIDADGPDTIITWDMHPSWLLHAADSTYGTPGEQTGDTSFLVIVSDGYRADSVLVNVNVIQVNDPPIIDSIGPKTANEGGSIQFMIHGYDIDRDSLTLGTFDLPNNAVLIDSGNGTGLFSFNPAYNQAGSYIVGFFVSDGILADTMRVNLVVLDVNLYPVLDSIGARSVFEGDHLEFVLLAVDLDGDSLELTADSIPENAVFIDSANGHGLFMFDPNYDQAGTYRATFIASDFKLSDTQIVEITVNEGEPHLDSVLVDGFVSNQRVVNHAPVISWRYIDPTGHNPQGQYEIAFGTNPDWSHAEMWNPEPFLGPDTFITYAGLPLLDGYTYYLRLRVHNGLAWSEWYNTSFRMNSLPSLPLHKSPANNSIVATAMPSLYLQNSTDPEGDPITYDFEVYNDSEYVVASASGVAQQTDSTGWMVDILLGENRWYRWRTRAFDGYEYSTWTVPTSFYINATEEPPSAFSLFFPPDTGGSQVYAKPVEFWWELSIDPDPFDSVRYKLQIAIDPNFTFTATYDSIYQTHYPESSLDYGTHYWWKVLAIDTKGNSTVSTNVADFWTWVLGDANGDRMVNVGDAVFIINYIFKGGAAPMPKKIGDANGDCAVNVGDAVYVINYIFKSGPAPQVGCAQ